LAEAWRKRRYEKAFVSKLNDAEAEAAETQVWLEYAVSCNYIAADHARQLYRDYDGILRTIVGMITHADTWILK
jgi:four helix bundle protein